MTRIRWLVTRIMMFSHKDACVATKWNELSVLGCNVLQGKSLNGTSKASVMCMSARPYLWKDKQKIGTMDAAEAGDQGFSLLSPITFSFVPCVCDNLKAMF